MSNIRLEDLEVYKVAMEIGEIIWKIVERWDGFSRYSLGNQIVRSSDSIALNIAEGYGRFHYKENKNFCYYSRGSAKETSSALEKARQRNLVNEAEYEYLKNRLDLYLRLSFGYIKSIGISETI